MNMKDLISVNVKKLIAGWTVVAINVKNMKNVIIRDLLVGWIAVVMNVINVMNMKNITVCVWI